MKNLKIVFKLKSFYFLVFFAFIFVATFLLKITLISAAGNELTPVPVGAYGAYGRYGIYGRNINANTNIMLDKFVATLPKGISKCEDPKVRFVDNFLSSDPRLKPTQEVCFKIVVKNTSETSLTDVKVQDFVPQFLEPIEGPGSFGKTEKTINFDAGNFKINEEKMFFIKMSVVSSDKLPDDVKLFCLQNKSIASTTSASDEDSTQVCIER